MAAAAEALERSFLQQEFLTVKMEIKARLDKSQNVTVSLDAWPDTAGRFVFCCTVALPDRCAPALQLTLWQYSLGISPL